MGPSVNNLLDFSNKAVIVTGASQGIGAGLARRFAEAGAGVVVHYRGGKSGTNELVDSIKENGAQAIALQADLSDRQATEGLVAETVETLGGLDVIINNAGIFPNASLLEMSLDEWHAMYSANVETAFLCTQIAANQMKKTEGGAIVNIASLSALTPVQITVTTTAPRQPSSCLRDRRHRNSESITFGLMQFHRV